MLKVNFHNLARQLTPPLKRHPARLALLSALVTPLVMLWHAFVGWRNYQRMLANVYGCKIVLEGFLRAKYGTPNIHIVSAHSNLPRIGLRAEGRNSLRLVGLDDETSRLNTKLRAEAGMSAIEVDFIVMVPAGVDMEAVRADIEHYKPHFATYNIEANYFFLTDDKNSRLTDDKGSIIILTP